MATNNLTDVERTADLKMNTHEKNSNISHLLRYVHTETLRKNHQHLQDTKLESKEITISQKDMEAAHLHSNNSCDYNTDYVSISQKIDSIIRTSEKTLCFSLWFILAAISEIYQPSYLAFSVYHIIFSLYFFTPDVDKVNPKTIARFNILLIGGFFVAMWMAFLCEVMYDGRTFDGEGNILVSLHKECE